jgi:adenylate cyclase
MPIEIERKFLVKRSPVTSDTPGTSLVQGYLPIEGSSFSVRARLTPDAGYLAIKGQRSGPERPEFECEIPLEMTEILLSLCGDRFVTKIRYPIIAGGRVWAVDVFQDRNADLILAEIELSNTSEEFVLPAWCGAEVTDDDRYYNPYLAEHPYGEWESS